MWVVYDNVNACVICKKAYWWENVIYNIFNVNQEKQGAKNGTLRNSCQNVSTVRFNPIQNQTRRLRFEK